jgi:hypothetical protein
MKEDDDFHLLNKIKELDQDIHHQSEKHKNLKYKQSELNTILDKNKNDPIDYDKIEIDMDEYQPGALHRMEKDYPQRKMDILESADLRKELELISNDRTSGSNRPPKKKSVPTKEDYNNEIYMTRNSVRHTKKTNSTGPNPPKTIEYIILI